MIKSQVKQRRRARLLYFIGKLIDVNERKDGEKGLEIGEEILTGEVEATGAESLFKL